MYDRFERYFMAIDDDAPKVEFQKLATRTAMTAASITASEGSADAAALLPPLSLSLD